MELSPFQAILSTFNLVNKKPENFPPKGACNAQGQCTQPNGTKRIRENNIKERMEAMVKCGFIKILLIERRALVLVKPRKKPKYIPAIES